MGFLLPPIFTKTADDIPRMMFYEAVIVAAMCVPSILLFREKPPTAPSAAADADRTDDFWYSMKLLFSGTPLAVFVITTCRLELFESANSVLPGSRSLQHTRYCGEPSTAAF